MYTRVACEFVPTEKEGFYEIQPVKTMTIDFGAKFSWVIEYTLNDNSLVYEMKELRDRGKRQAIDPIDLNFHIKMYNSTHPGVFTEWNGWHDVGEVLIEDDKMYGVIWDHVWLDDVIEMQYSFYMDNEGYFADDIESILE